MMNLNINLTLGSSTADSAMASPLIADDAELQSFSQTLADEIEARELTPPKALDDTRAIDPKLLDLLASRQNAAAPQSAAANAATQTDSESTDPAVAGQDSIGMLAPDVSVKQTVQAKQDGRIWLEDPMRGLPVSEGADLSVVELEVTEKPWFDIIEKAKSYGPLIQANAPAEKSVQQITGSGASDASGDVPLTVDIIAGTQHGVDIVISADSAVNTHAISSQLSGDMSAPTPEDIALARQSLFGTTPAATSHSDEGGDVAADTVSHATANNTSSSTANPATTTSGATSAATGNVLAGQSAVQTVAANGKAAASPLDSEQNHAAQSTKTDVSALQTDAAVSRTVPLAADTSSTGLAATGLVAESETVTSKLAFTPVVDKPTDSASSDVTPGIKPSELAQLTTVPANNDSTVQASSADASSARANAATMTSEMIDPATLLSSGAAAASVATGTVNNAATIDKPVAANSFAEHMKAVNQAQAAQPQQQSQQQDSQQQHGQGQAKLVSESLSQNPALAMGQVNAFGQQLQQATELNSGAQQSPVAAPVVSAVGHLATTTATAATRVPEQSWQAPLALTEPAAAQQIKDRVMVQIQQKLQTAEVQLHPDDLGSMQIKLNLQQDQLSVQFVVQQSAAKEALEQQMPKLRELLEQQGIVLSEGQVEQRRSGSQQEQQQGRHGQNQDMDTEMNAVQTVQMKVSDRMVDFYA